MTDDEYEQWMRNHGWQGCNLVNPLCPDDLCVLPASHRGRHQLMTDIEPREYHHVIRRCGALKGAKAIELVREGGRRAERLWRGDARA